MNPTPFILGSIFLAVGLDAIRKDSAGYALFCFFCGGLCALSIANDFLREVASR